jgi:hypothetical protein
VHSHLNSISPLSPRARTQTVALPAAPVRQPYIYVRVSTYAQKQEGFSLPHQFTLCVEAARANGSADIPQENKLHDTPLRIELYPT